MHIHWAQKTREALSFLSTAGSPSELPQGVVELDDAFLTESEAGSGLIKELEMQ